MVLPRSCRVIYYFDTPALDRRHQLFGRVTFPSISSSLSILSLVSFCSPFLSPSISLFLSVLLCSPLYNLTCLPLQLLSRPSIYKMEKGERGLLSLSSHGVGVGWLWWPTPRATCREWLSWLFHHGGKP